MNSQIKSRRLFFARLAAGGLILIAVLFFALRPASAGGGGIVDPNNPCAFNGFFGTFQEDGALLSSLWSDHGQTFTGVGSSITVPFSPSEVGGHKIYQQIVVFAFQNGMYIYNVYHIVTGCGEALGAPAIFLSDVCEPDGGFSGDGWMTLDTDQRGGLYFAASKNGPWAGLTTAGPPWVLNQGDLRNLASAAGIADFNQLWVKSGEGGTPAHLGNMIVERDARMDKLCGTP